MLFTRRFFYGAEKAVRKQPYKRDDCEGMSRLTATSTLSRHPTDGSVAQHSHNDAQVFYKKRRYPRYLNFLTSQTGCLAFHHVRPHDMMGIPMARQLVLHRAVVATSET